MALSASKTGQKIANLVAASDAPADVKQKIVKLWTDIMGAVYEDIKSDMSITIPSGSVITAVSGGSGSPAVGTPNVAPIDCDIDAIPAVSVTVS